MNRRGFMGSILAFAAAPAIVRADSLMRIAPPNALNWYEEEITLSVEDFVSGDVSGVTHPSLVEIIQTTLLANRQSLIDNIRMNNRLAARVHVAGWKRSGNGILLVCPGDC